MSGLVRIIVGVILIIVSVWWIVQGSSYLNPVTSSSVVTERPALADLITVANGSLPAFLILIGLLIVWLEWDTLKMEKQASKPAS